MSKEQNPFLTPNYEAALEALARGPMTSNAEGVLIRPVDQLAEAVRSLRRDLAAAREDVARMRKQIADHEEAEASVCPEDVGFVEFIGVLQKRIEQLKAALVGVTPSYRVKGKCWCPSWLDTRSGHSDECKAARALAIDSARAGGGK